VAANTTGVSNTVSTLNGLFKVRYAEKLLPLVPEFALLQQRVAFERSKKVGSYYAQPVQLASENGFTYLGTSGAVGALKDPAAGVLKEAQVTPSELALVAYMSNASITRAMESESSFMRETKWKVLDMNNGMRRRLEVAMLYGQSGLGTVDTVTANGSDADIVITAATWAGGIWAGAEGTRLDAFTGTTKNNSSGVLTVLSVNSDTRTLTVSFTGTLADEIDPGDELYFESSNAGSGNFNEMAGLKKIITNSSTLFNINAASYSLWKGNTVSSIGALSFAKISQYIALAVNKGLMEKVTVLVSPKAWSVLLTNEAALRMYPQASKTFENGAEGLQFRSQNGVVEVLSHPLVKDGDLFIVPLQLLCRIGSVDVSFALPGQDGEAYFDRVPGYNAVQLQCMADQALFLEKPAQAVYGSGITYS
jgi:hypothetical protein